jgi:hypothetical protein
MKAIDGGSSPAVVPLCAGKPRNGGFRDRSLSWWSMTSAHLSGFAPSLRARPAPAAHREREAAKPRRPPRENLSEIFDNFAWRPWRPWRLSRLFQQPAGGSPAVLSEVGVGATFVFEAARPFPQHSASAQGSRFASSRTQVEALRRSPGWTEMAAHRVPRASSTVRVRRPQPKPRRREGEQELPLIGQLHHRPWPARS